ncbi:hypothetical protein GYMLUDRAFT_63085 [Collybiopsis luxurians FD-317 M1]|uniref:Hydrophobin n=1 Tax=Collybiopsis luxurians FD-317 M1 TaxID=944289 RepID=A0A0D0C955_9AGAR|nr:hypothetical protein GYMLUDRAFT_63085 [Collybiopsis luxurians FD-317 M1]
MFSKHILIAFAFAAVASAAPLIPATVTACTGSINPPNGCVTIPVVSDSCINFTGGLSFLNKEVSNVQVPGGFICSFYEDFGCLGDQNSDDVVVLTGGTWSMFNVQGVKGPLNFNDLASSFTCSPI